MPISTRVTNLLGLEHPIVLAPMDEVAGGALAAAVSDAGGFGMIGGGYGDETWLTEQFARAAGSRVGCGFITWSLARQPRLLDVALRHRPAAVMLSFGDPTPFAARVHDAGAVLLCQVQDRAQAEHALEAGADVVVAQGCDAGGHGYGSRTTMTLVPEVADLLASRGSRAGLLAAGGIADGRGLAAALALGADGALVGSRFYATDEALSTPEARGRAVTAGGGDVLRTTIYDTVRGHPWPDGNTMSVLDNEFTARWHGREDALRGELDSASARYRQAVADRDYTVANVTIGQATGLIDSVLPAADIVTGMSADASARLAR